MFDEVKEGEVAADNHEILWKIHVIKAGDTLNAADVAVLLEAAKHPDPKVQKQAILAIKSHIPYFSEDQHANQAFQTAFKDVFEDVFNTLIDWIQTNADQEESTKAMQAIRRLVSHFTKDQCNAEVFNKAFNTLILISKNKAQQINVRQEAMETITELIPHFPEDQRNEEAFKAVVDTLLLISKDQEEESNVRKAAVWALGQLVKHLPADQCGAVVDTLILISNNQAEQINVRQTAVQALGQLKATDTKHDEVLTVLKQNASQKTGQNWEVRQTAVQALGQLVKHLPADQCGEVVDTLILISKDQAEESNVRQTAVQALGQIFEQLPADKLREVVDTLIPISKDQAEQINVRREAVAIFQKTGLPWLKLVDENQKSLIVATFLGLVDDPDQYIRDSASFVMFST